MRTLRTMMTVGTLSCLTLLVSCQADGGAAATSTPESPEATQRRTQRHSLYDKPGYITFIENRQLWIFEEGSDALRRFEQEGAPANSVTLVGAGPHQMDLRAPSRQVIDAYLEK